MRCPVRAPNVVLWLCAAAGIASPDSVRSMAVSSSICVICGPSSRGLETGQVWIGGGTPAGVAASRLAEVGLVLPLGDSPTVGIGGITSGGGVGWLTRRFGLTLDSLVAIELVCAATRRRLATVKALDPETSSPGTSVSQIDPEVVQLTERRSAMKFLCLAYGDEKDWNVLSKAQQADLLAADERLRKRGDLVAMVATPTVVRAWDGAPRIEQGPFGRTGAPLVGFSLIEARDLDEAIGLMAKTPCAVAKGAVELWPLVPA
jgi:hypothetical protein